MFSLPSLGLHAPHLGGLRDGLDGVGVQLAPAVARAAHYEDGGLVEHPVERARQRVVAREELVPGARRHVAGQYHGVGPFLLISAVDHIEEEVRARPVEGAPAHLVHDQAGRLHQRRDDARGAPALRRPLEPVVFSQA